MEGPERERMRAGVAGQVQRWCRESGAMARRNAPWWIVASLAASAVVPIALPLALGAGGAAAISGLLTQVGAVGSGYLSEVLVGTIQRLRGHDKDGKKETSPEIVVNAVAVELLARLDQQGSDNAQLRGELAQLLNAIQGVPASLEEAAEQGNQDVLAALITAFDSIGASNQEFAWMLDDLRTVSTQIRQTTLELQGELIRQGAEQRQQTEMQQRMLVTLAVLVERTAGPISQTLAGLPGSNAEPAEHQSGAPSSSGGRSGFSPYLGLLAYEPGDVGRYFGRERLTADLVSQLASRAAGPTAALMVTGVSGSGKSSLLRAGLIPALAGGVVPIPGSARWPWVLLTPGQTPLAELTAQVASLAGLTAPPALYDLDDDPRRFPLLVRQALIRQVPQVGLLDMTSDPAATPEPPPRLVLVIDQFEELFTLCRTELERSKFITALGAAAAAEPGSRGGAVVVIGVRADFYPRCMGYTELGPFLKDALIVGPMSSEELRRAIEGPAHRSGLSVDPLLTERLLSDIGSGPEWTDATASEAVAGTLPLVSYALFKTWRDGQGQTLTVTDYLASGGIRGALVETAERIYDDLDGPGRTALRRVLLRLVAIGDGAENTRRKVRRAELLGPRSGAPEAATESVLSRLIAERLVTAEGDTFEISHEALLAAWPRLRGWLAEDRDGLRIHRQLSLAAQEWERGGRQPQDLSRGTQLAVASEWAADPDHRSDLNALEDEFLTESIEQLHRQQRAARRATRRLRVLAGTLAVLIVVAGVVAVTALSERHTALSEQHTADEQRAASESLQLAAEGQYLRSADPRAALLLGVAAIKLDDLPVARSDLSATLANNQYLGSVSARSGPVNAVAFSPGGSLMVTGSAGQATVLWNVSQPSHPVEIASLSNQLGAVRSLAFSPNGHLVAVGCSYLTFALWDVTDPARPRRLAVLRASGPGQAATSSSSISGVAFSPDGSMLAIQNSYGQVSLWRMASPASWRRVSAFLPNGKAVFFGGTVSFGAGGRELLDAGDVDSLPPTLWNVTRPGHPAKLGTLTGGAGTAVLSPNGRLAVTATTGDAAILWNVADPAHPVQLATLAGHTEFVDAVAFAPDSQTLATASGDGTAILWSVNNPVTAATAAPMRQKYFDDATFAPTGQDLVTTGDSTATIWDAADPARPVRLVTLSLPPGTGLLPELVPVSAAVSSRGGVLLTSSGPMSTLWNIADPARPAPLARLTGQTTDVRVSAFSPNGDLAATASEGGTVIVWNVTHPSQPVRLGSVKGIGLSNAVVFVPGDRVMVTEGARAGVQLWDVTDPQQPRLLTSLSAAGDVGGIAVSPDGDTLATADADGTTGLWNITDPAHPQRLALIPGSSSPGTLGIAFSPDGSLLATSGSQANGSPAITLWDIASLTQPVQLATMPVGSFGVAFDPAMPEMVTPGPVNTALLWNISRLIGVVTEPVTRACDIAGAGLSRGEWTMYAPGIPYPAAICRP